MLNNSLLKQFSSSLQKALPPGMENLKADFEKVIKVELTALLEKMDLVSREEFDIQKGVLQRTREKVEALEKQLQELEKKQR